MNPRDDLYSRLVNSCRKRKLITCGDLVLAAVSGGPDSVAMLDLLHRWLERGGGFQVAAAHFNHRLRPEADAEQRLVEAFCRRIDVECITGSADVAALAREGKLSIHAAARRLRYRFLVDAALSRNRFPRPDGNMELPAAPRTLIATGHQRDDQVETVLMRLMSGSGVEGLAGIRRLERWEGSENLWIVRPLIDFSRRELEDYCRQRSLPFAVDRSNLDTRYPRNLIRRELVPQISSLFGGSAIEGIQRSAELADGAAQMMRAGIREALEQAMIENGAREVELDYRRFISYLMMIRTGILQRTFRLLAGPDERVSLERLSAAEQHITSGRSGAVELGGSVRAQRSGKKVYIWKSLGWNDEKLIRPGESVDIPGFGRLSAELRTVGECPLPPPEEQQYCDLDKLGPGPYKVKPAALGDRITPPGSKAGRRIGELLRRQGVPPHRRGWPIVWARGRPALVPPFRIAEWVRLTRSTRRVIAFTLTPEQQTSHSRQVSDE